MPPRVAGPPQSSKKKSVATTPLQSVFQSEVFVENGKLVFSDISNPTPKKLTKPFFFEIVIPNLAKETCSGPPLLNLKN